MQYDDKLTQADAKMLDALTKPVRKSMRYAVFVSKFLPFLSLRPVPKDVVDSMLAAMSKRTGEQHTVDDLHGNLLNEWAETVGNVRVEVEVYDRDSEGNDVFVYLVPPLLPSTDVVLGDVDGMVIHRLSEQAGMQAEVHPNLGTSYMLENIVPLIRQPAINERSIELWNKIYEYHGLPQYYKDEEGVWRIPTEATEAKPDRAQEPIDLGLDDYD